LGERAAAREAFDRAVAVNPRTLTARWFFLHALAPRWGGSIREMESLIDQARPFYGENSALKILDGRMAAEAGDEAMTSRDYAKSVEEFNRAIELGGKFWYYLLRRGEAEMRLRQYDAAITDLDEGLRLRPRYAAAHEHRGVSHLSLHHYDAAIADLSTALDLGRGTAQVFGMRGQAYAGAGKNADALLDLDRALEIQPNNEFYRVIRDAVKARVETQPPSARTPDPPARP